MPRVDLTNAAFPPKVASKKTPTPRRTNIKKRTDPAPQPSPPPQQPEEDVAEDQGSPVGRQGFFCKVLASDFGKDSILIGRVQGFWVSGFRQAWNIYWTGFHLHLLCGALPNGSELEQIEMLH